MANHYELGRKCSTCGQRIEDNAKTEFCNKHRPRKGSANSMFGRSVYDRWVEKYGVEEANIRKANQLKKLRSASKKLWEDSDYRKKVIERTTGLKRSDEFRLLQKEHAKLQMQKIEQRELRSKSMSKSWQNGSIDVANVMSNCYGHRGFHEGHFYSSNVELERIKFLQKSGVSWKRYEVKDFDWRIKYDWQGKQHIYLPDFVIKLENLTIIEEVKFDIRRISELERAKISAAQIFLPTVGLMYRVIDDPMHDIKGND